MSAVCKSNLSQLNSASIDLPYSDRRSPDWFVVTADQIQKVRKLPGGEFWDQLFPFSRPEYLLGELPLRVGAMNNGCFEAIYASPYYKNASKHSWSSYAKNFSSVTWRNMNQTLPAFLHPAASQMMLADDLLYNVERQWKFALRIGFLKAGQVQPHPNHMPHGKSHSDADPHFPITENNPGTAYCTADKYSTRFPNRSFADRDMIHFIGEHHWAPAVESDCVRVFVRGVAFNPDRYIPNP